MCDKRSAAIIGAGIGGIATAVYLSRNGYDVSVFEKNSSPGGRCGQLVRDGHRFDLGATMLMMPGIYREIFESLGIPLFENNEVKPLNELYRIYYDNNDILEFTSDDERMKEQLEKIEPGSYNKAREYVEKGYEIFEIGIRELIGRNFYNFFQFATLKNIGLLIRLKTYISNYRYASRFFRNRHLRMAYTFQNIYVGQSPFTSPALFSMVPAAELTEGSFYHEGGMFAIVKKLIAAAEANGVKFYYNQPVKRIKVSRTKAEALIFEEGKEFAADVIVANADLPYTYSQLLPGSLRSKRIDRMNYSCSAICYHWGLDKIYPQLSHHNVFLSDKFREGLDRIFIDKSVGDNPSFYVHAPVRSDPSAAPEGHDSLSFIVAAGQNIRKLNQDWDGIGRKIHVALVDRLKQLGLEDIEEHIKFEICYTPDKWESACNITHGAVFGSLAHNMMQMGYFRPHNRHHRYKNLYFVGGSTHPGNGIPNVLISSKLTFERIIRNK
jgi:phytoene desaturase